jgi:diacylglycerol kinase (ATP)
VRTYQFIINPAASRGKCGRMAPEVEAVARKAGLDAEFIHTTAAGEAIEIARAAANHFDCVVAVGGDGTVNEVANGLVGGKSAFGVVPIGSGNDFVKVTNVPLDITAAINILKEFHLRPVDVGKANDHYFVNGMGIGFDAWVVDRAIKVEKLRGLAIYLYSVLRTIYSYEPPLIKISYNGTVREEKLYMINIGNGTTMGGGFKLTPNAVIDDGLLDLNIVRNLNKFEIYQNLLKVFNGSHIHMPQVTVGRSDHLVMESEEGIAIHADGELLGLHIKKLEITLLKKAMNVVVPKPV